MATLICNANGNLTGSGTFARAETGANALRLVRNNAQTLTVTGSASTQSFTITNGSVIDGVILFTRCIDVAVTGTFQVQLMKGGVSQASVTINKTDLPPSSTVWQCPTFFKFTNTATGDGGSNWTIMITVTGTGQTQVNTAASGEFTRALRTTVAGTAAAGDDLYICGELTGAGTHTDRSVTMDSTAATAYGNGAMNTSSVSGGLIAISNWGTLTYGTDPGTNYILRVAGDVIVYQYGTLNIIAPQTSTTAVLEFQQASADCEMGLLCRDGSVVTITGQPRTPGKLVTKCKLTADVASATTLNAASSSGWLSNTGQGLDASGTSIIVGNPVENSSTGNHVAVYTGNAVTNVTQTAMIWMAQGTGVNNRYVRFMVGNSSAIASVSNGFYSDVDLLSGTASGPTAIGTGTATSVSITPVGRGWWINMTGKVSTSTTTAYLLFANCNAPGVISYTGSNQSTIFYDRQALVTASSISDTTFNVDTDTGWLAGDVVCVATTSRTQNECEIYPLNANAATSSFTSTLHPFNYPAATHSGTAPTQAEIGLVTRNVKIRSTSTTLMTYVHCGALATFTATWAEFCYLGVNTVTKRGIEFDGGAIANPKSITYCSIHDCDYAGFTFGLNSGASTSVNVTFSNNVMWNGYNNAAISLLGTWTNADYTIDSNLIMRWAGTYFQDIGGIITNNTVAGSSGMGFYLSEAGNPAILGTFDGNSAHSCATNGLYFNTFGISGIVSNFKAWRCTGSGITNVDQGCGELTLHNLTLFSNAPLVNLYLISDSLNITGNSIIAGEAAYAVQYGISSGTSTLVNYNVSGLNMAGGTSSFMPHTIAEFHFPNVVTVQGQFNNSKFGAPALFSGKTNWTNRSYLGFEKYNQISGDHRTEMKNGQLSLDTSIYNTASPSMRMTAKELTNKMHSSPQGRGMQVTVNSGSTVTASVWVRKDVTYYGNQPRLIVRANPAIGINNDTVLAVCTDLTSGSTPAMLDIATVTSVTLSGNNLVATNTAVGSGSDVGARVVAAAGKSSGKYYFESTLTSFLGGANQGVGVGTVPVANYSPVIGGALRYSTGIIYIDGATTGTNLTALSTGQVAGVAVDIDSHKLWFRIAPSGNWNNAAIGSQNPAVGSQVGGFTFSAGTMVPILTFGGGISVPNSVQTVNFGATPFTGAVPSGFTSGWPTPAYPGTETWVQLSGTTPAATGNGVMEFIVDCDSTGLINIDDWAVS